VRPVEAGIGVAALSAENGKGGPRGPPFRRLDEDEDEDESGGEL
jgi:hypothetical protein